VRHITAVVVVSLAVAACGDEGRAGQGSYGGPAPPAPRADARAGKPALLAIVRDRAVLLDGVGRIKRVLPPAWGELADVCPGGRRLVAAPDFSGFVEARTVRGRRLWRTRIPVAGVQRVGCLDGPARRVAVVLGMDRVKSLRIVTRASNRRVRRFAGELLALEPRRVYWRDDDTLHVDSLPSARRLESYAVPDSLHSVGRSPDGRHLALQAWNDPLDAPELKYLLDTATGAVRPIEDPELVLEGWRADGLLIARTPNELLALNSALEVRETVRDVRAQQVLVARSRVFTVYDRALGIVTAAGQRRIGTMPRQTWLIAAL
jgi:hypothetical protein